MGRKDRWGHEAYERKMAKYQELAEACSKKGCKTWVFPVEVGCRGFYAQSLTRMLRAVGIRGRSCQSAAQAIGKAAEGCPVGSGYVVVTWNASHRRGVVPDQHCCTSMQRVHRVINVWNTRWLMVTDDICDLQYCTVLTIQSWNVLNLNGSVIQTIKYL